jgi:glycosyltransferase involved in cell wall biosynthesis
MVRVSVIIPCFNQGHFVNEAVDSVLAQSCRDFEIIIVNDGSTDPETNRILANYDRPATRVLTTDNQGLAAARNNGIRAAKGEYILPLDADDRIGRTYLEQGLQLLDQQPELAIVYCRAQLFGVVETEWLLPQFSLEEMLLDNVIFCSAFFRKQDWQEAGGYDAALRHGWEDYDFWLTLLEKGGQVHQIPEILFHYRVAADSMVRARPRQHKVETFAAIFRKHQQLYADHIEVWVDRVLAAGQPYYQARLLVPGAGEDDPAWSRKVDTSSRCLQFQLSGQSGQLSFAPADQAVAVRIASIQLDQGAGRLREIEFSQNADFVQDSVCFFCSENGTVQFDLSSKDRPDGIDTILLINLEYLAFGSACVPLLIHLLVSKTENVPACSAPPVEPAILTEPSTWLQINTAILKRQLRSWRFYARNIHYRTLKQSGLFDAKFYLRHNRHVDPLVIDPLIHYIEAGWHEEKNPNPLFESVWYCQFYGLTSEQEPLLHYIEQGVQAGNNPNLLFFTSYYAAHYPESIDKGQTGLSQYLNHGWQEGKNPNPLFDSAFYLAQNPEIAASGLNPLYHYFHVGNPRLLSPMPFFDMRFYCEANPSVAREWMFPVLHFIEHGHSEGLSPNRFFDPAFYQEKYQLNSLSGLELFLHFVEQGAAELYQPSSLFEPEFYRKTYGAAFAKDIHPLEHYQEEGVFAGNYPCAAVADLAEKPVISILTPVFNSDEQLLRRCIHSVLYQAYPHWQLCLVDDGSSADHIRPILEEYAALDSRIKIRLLPVNQGIAPATNAAAELADGEYLAFLDHDDELTMDALLRVAEAINEHDPDLLYSDEDLVDRESRHLERFYKPDYNAELLLCHNYVTHFVVLRQSLFAQVRGLDPDCSGAQDYDLLLKAVEQAALIYHVRQPIYKWRASETSTSVNHGEKGYADAAGLRALYAAVERRGIPARVRPGTWKFYYEVDRQLPEQPEVTVIVLPAELSGQTGAWLQELIAVSRYPNVTIQLLVRKTEKAGIDRLPPRVTVHEVRGQEGDAAALNRVAGQAAGEHLVFIRQGVVPVQENWLEILLGYSLDEAFGMVCGMVTDRAGKVKDLAVPDIKDLSCALFRSFLHAGSVQLNGINCAQNVLAPSFDLCMVEQRLLQGVNGFDHRTFPGYFYGVDCAFRLRAEQRIEHLFTPLCPATAPDPEPEDTDSACSRERKLLQERWQQQLANNPYYNEDRLLEEQQVSRTAWLNWIANIDGQQKQGSAISGKVE